MKVNRFVPIGPTGPAVQTCGECHNSPFPSSAGLAHSSVSRDPDSDGKGPFNARSATSLYGDGIIQMLAEEMTEALQALRDEAAAAAKASPGTPVMRDLVAKGTKFGSIARHGCCRRHRDVRRVEGAGRGSRSGHPAHGLEGRRHQPPHVQRRRLDARDGDAAGGDGVAHPGRREESRPRRRRRRPRAVGGRCHGDDRLHGGARDADRVRAARRAGLRAGADLRADRAHRQGARGVHVGRLRHVSHARDAPRAHDVRGADGARQRQLLRPHHRRARSELRPEAAVHRSTC